MYIEHADGRSVTLVQPETSHAHVSARITFRAEEPYYLHQRIELAFHQRFCGENERSEFRSLWASYIHAPHDLHIYLKAVLQDNGELENWFGITKADHAADTMETRPLPNDREIEAEEHLEAMRTQEPFTGENLSRLPEVEWAPMALPRAIDGSLPFYYGFCHGSQLFLMMFKQPDQFRLAYSPCGGGKQPAWNPAWDYVLYLDDTQPGTTHEWDLCLIVKDFKGRADVLDEVRRYVR